MFQSLQLDYFTHCMDCTINPLADFLDQELIKQVKSIAYDIFSKLFSFFNSFNHQSREVNLKPIAMVSFLTLVTLFVISIFRKQGTGIISPPTPLKKDQIKE